MPSIVRRIGRLVTVVVVTGFILFGVPHRVEAAAFSSVFVRPERLGTSAAPGRILVEARVGEAVAEDELRITLGSAWSVSSTASHFTVATNNLPSGVVAWSGIGTAISATGQTVVFPSGDLTPGVTYGFYLTGGIPSNPATPGDSPSYAWSIATLQSGMVSSQSNVTLNIIPNDQVTITGSIVPSASVYSVEIQPSESGTVSQNTTVTYTIAYGSTYNFATPLTLQAAWPLGAVNGNGTGSIEFLEYVAGSAAAAFGATQPVVDLQNRTITWSIASFPAATAGQTVSFQLRTTALYKGGENIPGVVAARIINPVVTPDSESLITYRYAADSNPSQTEETSQTTTSTTTAPAGQDTTRFISYSLVDVTSFGATFEIVLSAPSAIKVNYGLNPGGLTQNQDSIAADFHSIRLTNLQPGSVYFIRFTLPNGAKSELIRFKTAEAGVEPDVGTIHLASDSQFYWSGRVSTQEKLLFPVGFPLEITATLENDQYIQNIVVYAAGKNDNPLYITTLTRTQPGVWNGRVASVTIPGLYEFRSVITTATGVRKEVPLFTLNISEQLRVIDAATGQPIERARIEVYAKDTITQLYQLQSAPDFFVQNPLYTTALGQLPIVLRHGEYRLVVTALGYQSRALDISLLDGTSFPVIEMERHKNSIVGIAQYHAETIKLKFAQYLEIFRADAQSQAVIQLVTLWTVLVSTPISIVLLLASVNFSLRDLMRSFFVRSGLIPGSRKKQEFLTGVVLSKITRKPIPNAVIATQDSQGKTQVVTQSLQGGRFVLPKTPDELGGSVTVLAPGYLPVKVALLAASDWLEVELSPERSAAVSRTLVAGLKQLVLNMFFVNLVVSAVLSVCFVLLYEKLSALPFFLLSLVNLFFFFVTIF